MSELKSKNATAAPAMKYILLTERIGTTFPRNGTSAGRIQGWPTVSKMALVTALAPLDA
ncbi:hypothetical protein [Spongiactinospora sp. 9N601]|uniref:hypothetical protein n=1 Tax=Spongiactinospora sp. 9N601 TaxID=3375149 RepID=UPI00379E5C18